MTNGPENSGSNENPFLRDLIENSQRIQVAGSQPADAVAETPATPAPQPARPGIPAGYQPVRNAPVPARLPQQYYGGYPVAAQAPQQPGLDPALAALVLTQNRQNTVPPQQGVSAAEIENVLLRDRLNNQVNTKKGHGMAIGVAASLALLVFSGVIFKKGGYLDKPNANHPVSVGNSSPSSSKSPDASPDVTASKSPSASASASKSPSASASPTSTALAGMNNIKIPCFNAASVDVSLSMPINYLIPGLPQPATLASTAFNTGYQSYIEQVSGTAVVQACITDLSAVSRDASSSLTNRDVLDVDDSKVQLVVKTDGLKSAIAGSDASILGNYVIGTQEYDQNGQPIPAAKAKTTPLTGIAKLLNRPLKHKAKSTDPDLEYDMDLKALQAARAQQAQLIGTYGINQVMTLMDTTSAQDVQNQVNNALETAITNYDEQTFHTSADKIQVTFTPADTSPNSLPKKLPTVATPAAKLPAIPTTPTKPKATPDFSFDTKTTDGYFQKLVVSAPGN